MIRKHTEAEVQRLLCQYIKIRYRRVVFRSDMAGNNQTSRYVRGANTVLQSHRGYPDLFIAEPVGKYHGLFVELKGESARVWLKDGGLSTDKHIREQADVLAILQIKGYCAFFAKGFDEAKILVDWYLGGAIGKPPLQMGVLETTIKVSNSSEMEF